MTSVHDNKRFKFRWKVKIWSKNEKYIDTDTESRYESN